MTEQPAEQQPPAADPLDGLDFTLECDMTHGTVNCHRPAAYIAFIHHCSRREGIRLLVCADFVKRLVETNDYPYKCSNCKKIFSSLLDRAWDIQDLDNRRKK